MYVCLAAQSCPTLLDPTDCSPPGAFVLGDFSRQEYWSGLPCPPVGDFPNQGVEPRSLALRQIIYRLSHQGSPRIPGWVAYPFSSGSSQPTNRTQISCVAGRSLPAELPGKPTQLSTGGGIPLAGIYP